MTKYLMFFMAVIAFGSSCTKSKPQPIPDGPGMIQLRVKDSVTIDQAFALLDSFNLPVVVVNGFAYTSAWPEDSIDVIRKYLSARKYVSRLMAVDLVGSPSVINVKADLVDVSGADKQDWLALIAQMKLTDIANPGKRFEISFPGQGDYWIKRLSGYAIVKDVSAMMAL